MAKTGSFFNGGTKEPHLQYKVNPLWVTSYVSSSKISPEDAKLEYLKTYTNCKSHIESLKYTEAELSEMMMDINERKDY